MTEQSVINPRRIELTRPGRVGLALGLAVLALGGCGGDGPEDVQVLAGSSGAGDQPKELRLSWQVTGEPDRYRIEVNPDGSSGFGPADVNGDGVTDEHDLVDGSATQVDVPLALHDMDLDDARYRIVALDAQGEELASAEDISPMAVSTEDLVGYFKASNPGRSDRFGANVALAADGDTLAVGAPEESSAATGIGADGSDDSADDAGAVYVFTRDDDRWSQQAYIKASNADGGDDASGHGDLFGGSVALADGGDILAVGARGEASSATGIDGDQTGNFAVSAGAVYVFARDERGTWSQQAYVKASNTDPFDSFGTSVALARDGDTLAVGATGEESTATGVEGDQTDDSAPGAGAAYVFTRGDQVSWSQQAYIKASTTGFSDRFGSSVALSDDGDTLAVGAEGEDSRAIGIGGIESDNSGLGAGAAYVFVRDGQGSWSQQAYIKASNTDAEDAFGGSVDLAGDGDTLAVGAVGEDSRATGINGEQASDIAKRAGAVYIFTRDDDRWSQQAYIKASNTDGGDNGFGGDRFGGSVALADGGDILAVGARREAGAATGIGGVQTDDSAPGAGAVYVFTRDDRDMWAQQVYLKASNTDGIEGFVGTADQFGGSVALDRHGDTLAVGATTEDSGAAGIGGDQGDNSTEDAGAVYLY